MKYKIRKSITLLFLSTLSIMAFANTPNQTYSSFNKVKRALHEQVYFDNRVSFYCGANYDAKKNVSALPGFVSESYQKRAKKIEWEHVVAISWIGNTFSEWRQGHPDCKNKNGEPFKGRSCASKVNLEYRFMQSDAYNLVPAIGAVNAKRSNFRFTQFTTEEDNDFGNCEMKIEDRKAQPPKHTRGEIARTHLYMAATYGRFNLSRGQQQLMSAWDKNYPVTKFECIKTKRIEALQKNENFVVKSRCLAANLWR
jgi:deoxyribonuclease-1